MLEEKKEKRRNGVIIYNFENYKNKKNLGFKSFSHMIIKKRSEFSLHHLLCVSKSGLSSGPQEFVA